MLKKLLAIVVIATVFFFNFSYVVAEENIMEGETKAEESVVVAVSENVQPEQTVVSEETVNQVDTEKVSDVPAVEETVAEEPVVVETPVVDGNETAEAQTLEEPVVETPAPVIKATKAAAHVLTINFVDTRTNTTTTKTYKSNSTNTRVATWSYVGLESIGMNYVNDSETNYKYSFLGWFTTDDQQVNNVEETSLLDGLLSIKKTYKGTTQPTTLDITVGELTEDVEITLSSKWQSNYMASVTLHIYDTRPANNNKEITIKNPTKVINTNTNGSLQRVDLDQVFPADATYTAFAYNEMKTKEKNGALEYKFVGWKDSNGNIIGSEGYEFPDEWKTVLDSYELKDERISNVDKKQNLYLTLKKILEVTATSDVDINIYSVWEEFTTANLTHIYEDEVSTGSGSWSSKTGGVVEYTHTFTNPEDKTPKEDYNFLYWQFELNDGEEDDQVDVNKKYCEGEDCANAKFTYSLKNKPSKWEGTVYSYAWWQASVTLNLYDGKDLLGTAKTFDKVSVSDVLEKDPEKVGYRFLGWLDSEGNKATKTSFEADVPSKNPEVRSYNLYASWERIMRDIVVTKEWDDSDNNDKVRPDSVTVYLKNSDETVETVELSEDNKWTYTFNVPQFDDKAEIAYTVEEKEVEGYTTEINGTLEDGFVITNTHAVETVKVSVTKVWDDKDNYNGMRPETVMVVLLADGEEVDSTLLSEENGWTYTFEAAKNADGKEIEYTIKEVEVENYWVEVEGNMTDGFTITNTYFGEGGNDDPIPEPEPETTPSSNPKTGDSIYTYIAMLLISLFGLVKTTFAYRKNN